MTMKKVAVLLTVTLNVSSFPFGLQNGVPFILHCFFEHSALYCSSALTFMGYICFE